jgi:hypothetical protein
MGGTTVVERPTSATIIGWLFSGLSILMVLSGAMAAVVWSLSPEEEFPPDTNVFEGEPWAFQMMFKMFDYFQYLIVLQFLLGVVGIAGGVGLLQLRAWGRALTELLTWLGLVYTVGYSLLWLTAVASFLTAEAAPPESRFIAVLMFVVGAVLFIAFLIPFIVVLVALRGKKIRSAIEFRSNEAPA